MERRPRISQREKLKVTLFICWTRCVFVKLKIEFSAIVILCSYNSTCLILNKIEAKKISKPQTQVLPLPQTQVVLRGLILEPINKALQEGDGKLKIENEILKDIREMSKGQEIHLKQELADEFKEKLRSVEELNQKAIEEIQRLKGRGSYISERKRDQSEYREGQTNRRE